jgi:hypothetical protein
VDGETSDLPLTQHSAREVDVLWWRCVWDHVFPSPTVADGEDLQCPVSTESGDPCGTSFIYRPFATEEEARGELPSGAERSAPWAR